MFAAIIGSLRRRPRVVQTCLPQRRHVPRRDIHGDRQAHHGADRVGDAVAEYADLAPLGEDDFRPQRLHYGQTPAQGHYGDPNIPNPHEDRGRVVKYVLQHRGSESLSLSR